MPERPSRRSRNHLGVILDRYFHGRLGSRRGCLDTKFRVRPDLIPGSLGTNYPFHLGLILVFLDTNFLLHLGLHRWFLDMNFLVRLGWRRLYLDIQYRTIPGQYRAQSDEDGLIQSSYSFFARLLGRPFHEFPCPKKREFSHSDRLCGDRLEK